VSALVGLIAIQLIRFSHENPSEPAPLDVPPQIETLLERACYDCHSNKTVWPWYSHIAPVSWLVYRDVEDGRKHLNFSQWPVEPKKSRKKYREISKVIAEDEMPMAIYIPLHPDARLSDSEKKSLIDWADERFTAGL
jgi:hypothetical protein